MHDLITLDEKWKLSTNFSIAAGSFLGSHVLIFIRQVIVSFCEKEEKNEYD